MGYLTPRVACAKIEVTNSPKEAHMEESRLTDEQIDALIRALRIAQALDAIDDELAAPDDQKALDAIDKKYFG